MGNSHQIPGEENLEEEDKFPCEICTEITSKNDQFKNKNLCEHPFCVDCIAEYAEVKIEDDETAEIKCPGLDCKQLLDPLSCRPILEPSLFVKWCDLLLDHYVLGFDRIFCPNRNCMALVVNECGGRGGTRGRVKKAQCPICKEWFCFRCKLAWHAGFRCKKSKKLTDPNDILFEHLKHKMNWARCPGCGHCVEREDGCGSVICRCKTEFCYYCGRKFPCFCNKRSIEFIIEIVLLFISLVSIYAIVFNIFVQRY